jgi:ABC-2 type transport system ATP-binding protein
MSVFLVFVESKMATQNMRIQRNQSSLLEHILIDTDKDAIVIKGVSKVFKKSRPWLRIPGRRPSHSTEMQQRDVRAIDNVSMTIKRREIMGILGANGSGKSTLVRMLSTLLIPDAGSIAIFGYDVIQDERRVQSLINRVSVEASFFKKLSPMENLIYAARLYNMPGSVARTAIVDILTRLGIKHERIHTPLESMSRGMQQKVAIARAFLTSPVVLLLDEPTTGLDPRSKIDVQSFVLELRENHDATILLTTHDMEEAEALCDRVAIIDKGRVVAMGEAEALKHEVATRMEREVPATMQEVFMYYTASRQITAEDVQHYGSWEKAFEVLEAQRADEK